MNKSLGIKRSRFLNEQGDINIVVVALTLPIVMLVAITAVDIVRIIINKQQLYGALQSGSDRLLHNLGAAPGIYAEKLWGRDRCAVVPDNMSVECNQGCEFTTPPTCSGSGSLGWAGTPSPLRAALEGVEEDVSGAFGIFNMGQLADENLTIVVAAYNLVVNGVTAGNPADSQVVVNKVQLGVEKEGPYKNHVDPDQIIEDKFITPGNLKLGSIYGYTDNSTPNATHVSVVVLWAAYRVEHKFNFPSWLKMGIAPVDTMTDELIPFQPDETYINASIVKVLPFNIRMDM